MSARPQTLLVWSSVIGGLAAGIPGGVVGFVVGWRAYQPTAVYAAFEVGGPIAVIGAAIGFLIGSIILGIRRLHATSSG
jgi:uncharacterized membrane protein